jgi:predicted aspartyl protease
MGGSADSHTKKDVSSEEDVICFYYINEDNVETCPQIKISIGKEQCKALIDTGCQCSVMSEELYEELKTKGHSLELPAQNVVLKSAFTGKIKRARWQALVKLHINNTSIDQIILISPQLVTPFLLGMDFYTDNHVVINFHNNTLIINAGNEGSEALLDLVKEE